MTTREVQEALRTLGWPIKVDGSFGPQTFEAVQDFQRAYAWWNLLVDGHGGAKTHDALRHALENDGRCSLNFRFKEFASKGNGWIRVHRELVRGLEEYRELVGGPVVVVSGYRDQAHNQRVGGARSSQHLYGNAIDLAPAQGANAVKRLRCFSGIGIQRATGLVRHVRRPAHRPEHDRGHASQADDLVLRLGSEVTGAGRSPCVGRLRTRRGKRHADRGGQREVDRGS